MPTLEGGGFTFPATVEVGLDRLTLASKWDRRITSLRPWDPSTMDYEGGTNMAGQRAQRDSARSRHP